MRIIIVIAISLSLYYQVIGQDQVIIDSLKQVIAEAEEHSTKVCTNDTAIINAYLFWGEQICFQQPDTALRLWFKSEQIALELLNSKPNSKIIDATNKILASLLNNIGYIYFIKDDISKALEYYHKSLKIKEELGDEIGMATSFNNIGLVYKTQGDYILGLENYNKSLSIQKKLDDTEGMAASYNNIGLIYKYQNDLDNALDCYDKSLKYFEELNDKYGMASVINNIGSIYEIKDDYVKALEYYNTSLKLYEDIGFKRGVANASYKLGMFYLGQNNISKLKFYAEKSYKISKEMGFPENIKWSASLMKELSLKLGNFDKAFSYLEEEIAMKDSILNEENYKKIQKQQAKYEYEKQAAVDSIAHKKAIEIKDLDIARIEEEKKAQAAQRNMLILGLSLMALLAIIIFRSYSQKKKANTLLSLQKQEIEEQKQEILDSITYAKRIQTAILPPQKVIKEYLKDSFILYKPKDIVAGDFYWMEHKSGKVLFAAADCTGHGVPGAMVSVVCNNALNRSVREYDLTDPGLILDKVRELVLQEFEKSDEEVKDGMDIALCSLEGNTLKYAGANNPLWLIRNGEIIETKANKQPIGKFDNPLTYTTHSFLLEKEDIVYIFSDGYLDQFGGEKGKKFKSKAFKELLLSLQGKAMEEQKQILYENFENWRGKLEQIDDVCIIGVRI